VREKSFGTKFKQHLKCSFSLPQSKIRRKREMERRREGGRERDKNEKVAVKNFIRKKRED